MSAQCSEQHHNHGVTRLCASQYTTFLPSVCHKVTEPGCCVQTLLAAGLLQLRPMKPRTVGLIGVIASLMNCYMLYPKLPAPALTPPKSYAEATSSTQQPKMELKKA